MKQYNYLVAACMAALLMAGCTDSGEDIGVPLTIAEDYTLPQQGASAADNERIRQMYDKYGSYFLYDFTNKDAMWVQITGNASSGGRDYYTTLGNPNNVGAMLDFLTDTWLKYFPNEFLKKGGIPYKVFMADSLYMQRDFGNGDIRKYVQNYMINGNSLIVAGMNRISTIDEKTKKTRKLELITALWTYYIAQKLIDIPQEFYSLSNYTVKPTMSDTIQWGYKSYYYSTADLDALRNRGFIPKYSPYGYNVYSEIYMQYSETSDTWTNVSIETLRNNDYQYYLSQIFNATDEQVIQFLKYPLVKQKWDLLLNYYKDKYGIDLRKIATE
ncbi:MAG TPA: hypothetical protein VIQ97_04725 [Prevotella sp.]